MGVQHMSKDIIQCRQSTAFVKNLTIPAFPPIRRAMLMLAFALISLLPASFAQTWTGNVSNDWNTPTNWSTNAVPLPTGSVIIPTAPAGNRWPQLAANTTITVLTMQAGSELNCNGFEITCNNNFAITGATLSTTAGATITLRTLGNAVNQLQGSTLKNNLLIEKPSGTGNINEASTANNANTYEGHVTISSTTTGTSALALSTTSGSSFQGNVTINVSNPSTHNIFTRGVGIAGNFSYTNTAGGNVTLGSNSDTTIVGGMVQILHQNVAATTFTVQRLEQTGTGGSILISNTNTTNFSNNKFSLGAIQLLQVGATTFNNNLLTTTGLSITNRGNFANFTMQANNITGPTDIETSSTSATLAISSVANSQNVFNGNLALRDAPAATITFNIANGAPITVNGNVSITRNRPGNRSYFTAGSTITGNLVIDDRNANGISNIGNATQHVSVGGSVDVFYETTVAVNFNCNGIKQQGSGGKFEVKEVGSLTMENNQLNLSGIFSLNTFAHGSMLNNNITAPSIFMQRRNTTSGFNFQNNTLTGNTQFNYFGLSNNISSAANAACTFNGNLNIINKSTSGINMASGSPVTVNGNLTIQNDTTGPITLFTAGGQVTGNLTVTAKTLTSTATFGSLDNAPTIGGIMDLDINFNTPGNFNFIGWKLPNPANIIKINNPGALAFTDNEITAATFEITDYPNGTFARNTVTVPNFVLRRRNASSSFTYANNVINGNSQLGVHGLSYSLASSANSACTFNGNVDMDIQWGGLLQVGTVSAVNITGNFSATRIDAGESRFFTSETATSIVGGAFSFVNKTSGTLRIGNTTHETQIGTTINIDMDFPTPASVLVMEKVKNAAAGGNIILKNGIGFSLEACSLRVNQISLESAGNFVVNASLSNNHIIAQELEIKRMNGNQFPYVTFIAGNTVDGNTSIYSNETGALRFSSTGSSTGIPNTFNGDFSFTHVSNLAISVGTTAPITVGGDATFHFDSNVTLGHFLFNGQGNQRLKQTGTRAVVFDTITLQKPNGTRLQLEDSVGIKQHVDFSGGNIVSDASKEMIFQPEATTENAGDSSHIVGPVVRLGANAFTFPVGSGTAIQRLAMSAPGGGGPGINNRYRLHYINANPHPDFDTSKRPAEITTINTCEYWLFERQVNNFNVDLTFDFGAPCGNVAVPADLRVLSWNGNAWTSLGNGGTTGSGSSGTIMPENIVSQFGAFTLGSTTALELPPSSGFNVQGPALPCLGVNTYTARNVQGSNLTYHWSLPQGGGTLNFVDSVATVTWNETGPRSIALFVSNNIGNSETRSLEVVVNPGVPTLAAQIQNFARNLSLTNTPPAGSIIQWYRNENPIDGANQTILYAEEGGTYTAKFVNGCGEGPASNGFSFAATVLNQTITVLPTPPTVLQPGLRIPLKATTSSGLPVFYQKLSGGGTIVNDTLVLTSGIVVGNTIIRYTQPGDDTYRAAMDVTDTISILRGNQTIAFDPIPDTFFSTQPIPLQATSSAGLTVQLTIVAGSEFATINPQRQLVMRGVGNVTVRAVQNGNVNYNTATPVERTFCIGVKDLPPIEGDTMPCLGAYTYTAKLLPGALYEWSLSSGGTLTTQGDTARVQWQTAGSHTLSVRARSGCNTNWSQLSAITITTSDNSPAPVSGMIPLNNTNDLGLPILLTWIAGVQTTQFDVFIWDSASAQPATPFATNLNAPSFTVPLGGLSYNQPYAWRVVSKNPCAQTPGPIQYFRLIPLPDLAISNLQAPSVATAGQTISFSWTVTNNGPGRTLLNQKWNDAIFLSFDTMPNFRGNRNWNPNTFSNLQSPLRPLLVASRPNLQALEVGQSYTNSVNFTIPINYNQPLYVYGITNDGGQGSKFLQTTFANDTTRKTEAMQILPADVPDLRVDSVFTTASVFSGTTIDVAYRVTNYGALTPPGGVWVDSIFISQNPLWNREDAISVNLPKARGSYYPNAVKAHAYISNTQLQRDSSYTRNVRVVMPNFIFGTWFVYVKTNAAATAANRIYEGPFGENNVNRSQIQLLLSPTPTITIQDLQVPLRVAGVSQKVGLNWNTVNTGFNDNAERSKGHYVTIDGQCVIRDPRTGRSGFVPRIRDSIGFGSSYWIERVYLSTNPNQLIESEAVLIKVETKGNPNRGLFVPDFLNSCGGSPSINIEFALNPRASFPTTIDFNIPGNFTPGDYYVYVYANPTKTVFEFPGTPQITRSALPITIQAPDLTVSAISMPTTSTGGTSIPLNYTLRNNGPSGLFNQSRIDAVHMSYTPNFNDATVVASINATTTLAAGAIINSVHTINLPDTASAVRYYWITTNFTKVITETNYTNNRSSMVQTNLSPAVPADLIVRNVSAPITGITTLQNLPENKVTYTVRNQAAIASGTWTDQIYASCQETFNPAQAVLLGTRTQNRTLGNGDTYIDSLPIVFNQFSYELNPCFPRTTTHLVYYHVVTNAAGTLYEGNLNDNNVGVSFSRSLTNQIVDHVVPRVTGAPEGTVSRAYTVNWQVSNQGANPINTNYYKLFTDEIYFSPDSVWNNNAVLAGSMTSSNTINGGDTVLFNRAFAVPNIPTGVYYLWVVTNARNQIKAELNRDNNRQMMRDGTGKATTVAITRAALPDLKLDILAAPTAMVAGQPVELMYQVTNLGDGFPSTNTWTDDWEFSLPNTTQRRAIGNLRKARNLLPGESYTDVLRGVIPLNTDPGNYILRIHANSRTGDNVFETNMNNNTIVLPVIVTEAPQSDLVVQNIRIPDTVYLGQQIDTVFWKVANQSANQMNGQLRDGVYLIPPGGNLSENALVGTLQRNLTLAPIQDSAFSLRPLVSSLTEGDYEVWVRTDIGNNINESNKDNNATKAEQTIHVKVKELVLEQPVDTSLQTNTLYYRLEIPDSLIGATIRVSLRTGDSLTMRNEIYIGEGFIPSRSQFTYRFERQNFGNQQIVMPDAFAQVYYIAINCVSPTPVRQQATVKAEVLPFAILTVNSPSGGNAGNVTVRLDGSLFTEGMTARLTRNGTVLNASQVFFTNSTIAYATFNLLGATLGLYDISLHKGDTATALLPNDFSVVPPNSGGLITGSGPNTGPTGSGNEPGCDPGASSGLNSLLVADLGVPEVALIGSEIVIQINYANPTNVDLPVQTRILYAEKGLKLSLSRNDVANGKDALYLELTEPGGPPGILRAGARGTIVIYSRAPARIPVEGPEVLFKLN